MPQARQAHFKLVQPSKPGLSFKTQQIPVDRIPMPKNWEVIKLKIDLNEETFFKNIGTNENTRQDPRLPIKTHLEELHVQLTAEMISRINNPSAFNPVSK